MAIAGFCFVLWLLLSGNASALDDPVRQFFYGLRTDALTPMVIAITTMSDVKFVVALCLLLLILRPTRITYGIPVSAGALLVTIVNKSIKHIIQRPRPEDILHLVNEGGFSFPSGHSITSMFVYSMLLYLIQTHVRNRKLRAALSIIAAIGIVLVGPSRIYLGVHYPTDVLAGWCLGFAALMFGIEILKRVERRRNISGSK